MSFKGTNISIADIKIENSELGSVVSFRVLFADKDGVVHAHTAHKVAVGDPDSPFHDPVKLLLEACRAHAMNTHFEGANDRPVRVGGIAEVLSGIIDPDEDFGVQD